MLDLGLYAFLDDVCRKKIKDYYYILVERKLLWFYIIIICSLGHIHWEGAYNVIL
jgi:hypothetical protein